MTKSVLIPLSAIVPCEPNKSKEAFVQLGVTSWQLLRHWFSWNNLIGRYRNGLVSHEQFRESLKAIFPVLKKSRDAAIDDAWNAMCQYDEQSMAGFQMIKDLEQQGLEIYTFASTNEKHVEFIQQKLHNALNRTTIPGKHFWSFERKQGFLGQDLVTALVNKIKAENPSSSIELFFTQPVDPAPGLLGWFQKPYAKFMHQGAVKHVNQLRQNANRFGYELIECKHDRLASVLEEIYSVPKQEVEPFTSAPILFQQRKSIQMEETNTLSNSSAPSEKANRADVEKFKYH